jgi:hypothetical protein
MLKKKLMQQLHVKLVDEKKLHREGQGTFYDQHPTTHDAIFHVMHHRQYRQSKLQGQRSR